MPPVHTVGLQLLHALDALERRGVHQKQALEALFPDPFPQFLRRETLRFDDVDLVQGEGVLEVQEEFLVDSGIPRSQREDSDEIGVFEREQGGQKVVHQLGRSVQDDQNLLATLLGRQGVDSFGDQ